jgi:transposase-like protein
MKSPTQAQKRYAEHYKQTKSYTKTAQDLGVHESTVRKAVHLYNERAKAGVEENGPLKSSGYDVPEYQTRTPSEAWNDHSVVFERKMAKILQNRWPIINRPKGAFVVFHATDTHVDDDATPLKLLEKDIQDAHGMDAVMCHGGDLMNNWSLAGRLAKQWADQACTKADSLLRAQHFIDIFKPDVWTHGNHEEFNPYLSELIESWLPDGVIKNDWTANFKVETPGGRTLRAVLSHKFQKGSSWFHKAHGHIREMLEGEEADLLMDGHLHSDGVLEHTLPERGHSALCVASSGYKVVDKYAARISRGGTVPKLRGRAHWIVVDPYCEQDWNFCTAFTSARQAEAYLNGLANIRTL